MSSDLYSPCQPNSFAYSINYIYLQSKYHQSFLIWSDSALKCIHCPTVTRATVYNRNRIGIYYYYLMNIHRPHRCDIGILHAHYQNIINYLILLDTLICSRITAPIILSIWIFIIFCVKLLQQYKIRIKTQNIITDKVYLLIW